MKEIAIEKAMRRLDRAWSAFMAVDRAANFEQFELAWSDYLLAINGIHSILEAGARGNPQSRAWIGRKKNERRKDPLLSYLHQARNSDEHGIEPVAQDMPGVFRAGAPGEHIIIDQVRRDGRTEMHIRSGDGKPPTVEVTLPHARLVTVRDERYGDTYDPPTEHLGKPLLGPSEIPYWVAAMGIRYYAALIEEAKTLVTSI